MPDEYFKYEVWRPKPRAVAAKKVEKKKSDDGALALPFPIHNIRISPKGVKDSMFAIAYNKDDGTQQAAKGDDALLFAPPVKDIPGGGMDPMEKAAIEEDLQAQLLAALEARDGFVFEEVRGRLSSHAALLLPSEALELEEKVSMMLGPTWWEFVEEDAEAAECFRHEFIREPIAVEAPAEEPAAIASQVASKITYLEMRASGLILGPRFRTRRTTYGAKGFRPSASMFM